LASVNAGVINNDGLGQFATFGSQSGSTRSEACGAVLSDLCHASSTRRYPRPLARWQRGRESAWHPLSWTVAWRAAGVVPGASRRVSTPTSAMPEGARSDGSASTSCRVIRDVRVSLAGACRDRPSLKPAASRRGLQRRTRAKRGFPACDHGGRRPVPRLRLISAAAVAKRLLHL
jgi:hypothetical protein